MNILVCGGRNYTDIAAIYSELNLIQPTRIIAGDAPGADFIAIRYAQTEDIPYRVFKADWKTYGKAAGPKRNLQMIT